MSIITCFHELKSSSQVTSLFKKHIPLCNSWYLSPRTLHPQHFFSDTKNPHSNLPHSFAFIILTCTTCTTYTTYTSHSLTSHHLTHLTLKSRFHSPIFLTKFKPDYASEEDLDKLIDELNVNTILDLRSECVPPLLPILISPSTPYSH
jgi:hypothetical protein